MKQVGAIGVAIAAIALAGCDTVLDCLDDDGPRFPAVLLDTAVLNEVYSDTLRVSIDNEPRDDSFLYNFNITGALPAGLTTASSGRDFIFSGTPTELGTFQFTLFVEIDERFQNADSGLCFYSDNRRYQLTVEVM